MPRFTKAQQHQKILQAKDLYIKGFDYSTIADTMDIAENTVRKWGRENGFEDARNSNIIALSEMRNIILQSFSDVCNGKDPKISAEKAVKYAAAFEKFSDKKKVLTYMYEGFELLTTEYIAAIEKAEQKQDRQRSLDDLKVLRDKMDKVITRLTNEVLKNE